MMRRINERDAEAIAIGAGILGTVVGAIRTSGSS